MPGRALLLSLPICVLPALLGQGRIGRWALETWCEFDSVKVTRLVPVP